MFSVTNINNGIKKSSGDVERKTRWTKKEMIEYFDDFVCSAGPYGTPADPLKEMIGADPGLEFFV